MHKPRAHCSIQCARMAAICTVHLVNIIHRQVKVMQHSSYQLQHILIHCTPYEGWKGLGCGEIGNSKEGVEMVRVGKGQGCGGDG